MARFWFGGGTADYVADANGRSLSSRTVTFWDAETGGVQLTDLLDANGAPITQLVSGAAGRIPRFQGPDGVAAVWADAGGSFRARLDADDEVPSDAAVAALLAVASSTRDAVDGRVTTVGNATYAAQETLGAQLISVQELGASATSITVDLSAATDYEHIVIEAQLRSDRSGGPIGDGVAIRCNGDSGANYQWQQTEASNATSTALQGTAQTSAQVGSCPASTAVANSFGTVQIVLSGFRRPTLKVFRGSTVLARLVSSGELRTIISGGLWNSTAAITSVQIRPTIGPNFVAGSRVAVYGYRGAVPFV